MRNKSFAVGPIALLAALWALAASASETYEYYSWSGAIKYQSSVLYQRLEFDPEHSEIIAGYDAVFTGIKFASTGEFRITISPRKKFAIPVEPLKPGQTWVFEGKSFEVTACQVRVPHLSMPVTDACHIRSRDAEEGLVGEWLFSETIGLLGFVEVHENWPEMNEVSWGSLAYWLSGEHGLGGAEYLATPHN